MILNRFHNRFAFKLTAGMSGIAVASCGARCHRTGMMDSAMLMIGLSFVFVVVLVGPFLNKKIEANLEAFLFVMGVISATLSKAWSAEVK
jgi:hypothetical protein